jgi:hypothetical protein
MFGPVRARPRFAPDLNRFDGAAASGIKHRRKMLEDPPETGFSCWENDRQIQQSSSFIPEICTSKPVETALSSGNLSQLANWNIANITIKIAQTIPPLIYPT